MAPAKRKRGDRVSIDSYDNRPSPHRPQNINLAQYDMRDGHRRPSRGGQGGLMGRGGRRIDIRDNPNQLIVKGRATPTPGPLSPPQRPPSATQTPSHTPIQTDNIVLAPKSEPIIFDYSFITDDRISKWEYSGRESLVTLGIQARRDEDTMDLGLIFQELTKSTLDGRINPEKAGSCVYDILGTESAEDPITPFNSQTFFLDILSMVCEAEESQRITALRSFVVATGISPVVMRQNLDGKLLQELGLTRETFVRVGVRQATNLLYRQANYNLLREETEGYAKLVAELFTTSESERPSSEAVEDAFERVKGLIGTFDLDVGRVLDITLDVFASILIKHYRFFIKLLRISSWWPRNTETDSSLSYRQGGLPKWGLPTSAGFMPTEEDEKLSKRYKHERDAAFWARARQIGLDAFFELSGSKIIDEKIKDKLILDKKNGKELNSDQEWIISTGTCPPSGNYVAAQLLGFKLRFYTSDTRDEEDVLPPNLMYLTALLIKIGFISLRDLYPHLWPPDEAMPALRESKLKELEEKEKLNRLGGGMNALMMAGALPDDTPPTRSRETPNVKVDTVNTVIEAEEKDKIDEPTDQKVLLLVCLLTIGAIPEALFILGRFPWLPEAYPELIELINRILNYSIKDIYEESSPISKVKSECLAKMVPDLDQSGMPKGQLRLSPLPTRKQLRWPFPDKFDTNENLSYRFYWDEWTDNIPLCQCVDDIFTLCMTFLNFSGVNIGKDATLLSKLARIGTKSLATDQSEHNLERWQDLLKRLLVPALSLTKANTSLANEIYELLRFYPLSVRFSIYAEWFEGQTSRIPAIKIAFTRAKLKTQSILKRISLTNVTQMAKSLAKTGYASPGVVFSIALGQIEAYTNLTEVVVECAKYFTDLGYEVLVWSLLNSLGGKSRNRINSEYALLPSRWLLALSSFAGKVYRRYGIMNLSPIIQYINDQLYKGNATDLVILKELISQMAGIVPDTDYTDAQLVAMTGGEALRRQTLISLHDKRFESTKTAKRLMRALADTNLSGELLVAIAQHRQSAIYRISDEEAHIKLLATMIDDTQSILFQYLDLLRYNLSIEEFDKQVPGIPELLTEYGLQPALAFMIGRGSITNRISRIPFSKESSSQENFRFLKEVTPNIVDSEGNVETSNKETQPSKSKISNGDVIMEDVKIDEVQQALAAASPPPEEVALPSDMIQEIIEPVMNSVKIILPEESFRGVTPEFYVTFWVSTLSDFSIPSSSYENKVQELLNQVAEIGKDRSDMSRQGMARKEEMKKTLNIAREAVLKEFAQAIYSYPHKKARFLKSKALWFNSSAKADEMSDFFLEKCIFPRLLLSPSDADYCFRLIKLLHDNGVPHFRTLSLYGRIFRANRLRSLIFSCTIREAEQLGRFLRLVLTDLARWHADSTVYEKEAWGPNKNYPGFAKSLDTDGKPKALLEHDGTPGFRHVFFGWQKALNTALRDCLDGVEWMHIRNAITILKTVAEVFPAVDFMGNSFIKQLETIAKRELKVREDLALTSNATLVQLKKKSKRWVIVQAYGNNLVGPAQNIGSANKSSTVLSIKSTFNPNTIEMTSKSRASSLTLTTSKTTSEVEDGEVDDTKISAPIKTSTPNLLVTELSSVEKSIPTAMETRKSEILDRREQIKRENAAKSSTQTNPSITLRPETVRAVNVEWTSHILPNRPDAPFPSRDIRDRHLSRHSDRRDNREMRNQDQRIVDRAPRPGDRSREFSGERRNIDLNSRDFGRPDRERTRPESNNRWNESLRENGDRVSNPRTDTGRLSREMPPPRNLVTSDRTTLNTLERIPANSERQELINPERAALISGDNDNSRSNSPRRARDDSERVSPKPRTPKRSVSDSNFDQRWNERSSRGPPSDAYNNPSRGRKDEGLPPPAGPRDRSSNTDRSLFSLSTNLPNFTSTEQSKPNTNSRQPLDPNFGRLNLAPPSPEIPSGPRDVWMSRVNRMNNTPTPRHDRVPAENLRPPTPDRQPPTGPSGRHNRRDGSNNQSETPNAALISLTSTVSTLSPLPGVHPDRLKSLGNPMIQHTPTTQAGSVHQIPSIHPDRLRALGESSQNISNQSNHPRIQSQFIPNIGPPSGPKGSQATTSGNTNGSGSNSLTAPTGPASASERAARGTRRQLAGINTMLQSNSDRPTVRGRGRVTSGINNSEVPFSNNANMNIQAVPGSQSTRVESISESDHGDLFISGNNLSEDRDRERSNRRERSGRHSRKSSRSADRERDTKRSLPDEERGYRDRSDRRFNERDSDRDVRHTTRIFGENLIHNGRDRDRERVGRRDGRERDPMRDQQQTNSNIDRGGGDSRSGRGRDFRGGEERRDSRGARGEDGRKRNSDEGGIDPRKRVRRG